MKARATLAASAAVLLVTMLLGGTPRAAHAEPELAEATPAYGDVIQALPEALHLCFTEPVKVETSDDWAFSVVTPTGQTLGIRIEFRPEGSCVDVFPGAPDPPPEGIWTFDWLVRSQADDSEGSGTIKFQLGQLQPGETPLDRPDSPGGGDGDDDGSSAVLLVAIGVGAVVILAASAGFVVSRRRRA